MLYIRFVWRILHHKFWVIYYGLQVGGIPLGQLLVHDMSKFSRAEFAPKFRVQMLSLDKGDAWKSALDHHHAHNAHHWQYWTRDGKAQLMPEIYAREMLADWLAAEKTYRTGMQKWFDGEYPRMRLHPETVKILRPIAQRFELLIP
jgi:hypothetical protein